MDQAEQTQYAVEWVNKHGTQRMTMGEDLKAAERFHRAAAAKYESKIIQRQVTKTYGEWEDLVG